METEKTEMLIGIEAHKKLLYLFFVLDSSGSMQGANIQAVNTACKEALESDELRKAGGAEADIHVGVLEFSTGCRWMTQEPMPIEQFPWRNLSADGGTDLGQACRELNKKLSKEELVDAAKMSNRVLTTPVIILMSDGEPTDDFDSGLAVFKRNPLYKKFIKVACAVDNANEEVLARFTGNKELVLKVHTPEALIRWIKVVSMVMSGVASKNQGDPQEVAVEKLKEEFAEDPILGIDIELEDED